MGLADVFIVVLFIGALFRGIELGFVRQLFSTVGFFIGLFVGAMLQGMIIDASHSASAKALLSIMFTLGAGILFLSIGEYIGMALQAKIQQSRARALHKADRGLGSLVAGSTLLAAVWLLASILSNVPSQSLQRAVQESRIIASLNQTLPPAPETITKLGHLINPNGFPEVFIGLEPNYDMDMAVPDAGEMQPAVDKAAPSVVKIAGRGCGGIVNGTGFVAGERLVVTNAHVVAGVARPIVIDEAGEHSTRVIWFDPKLDMAILRATNLAGEPLELRDEVQPQGTPGVVLGYPGGGPLTASTSMVLDSFGARGRDIYNSSHTVRSVYSLKAIVDPGNSGGPLLDKQGAVIGLIFAESTTHPDVAYALTMDTVIAGLEKAIQQNHTVDTGTCVQ